MGANTKFGAKEVMDVILYDMSTNKPVIFFDTLKTSSIVIDILISFFGDVADVDNWFNSQ